MLSCPRWKSRISHGANRLAGQPSAAGNGQGELVGALPGYLKNHSQGEYVFDHGWADAFERAGGRYYPKLQCSIPFTPATGPRLLVAEGLQRLPIQDAIAESLKEVVRRLGVSSAHITFVPEDEIAVFEGDGLSAPDRPAVPFHQ